MLALTLAFTLSILLPGAAAQALAANCTTWHEVQPADTCSLIAEQAGFGLEKFFRLNPDVDTACQRLLVGQYVCVNSTARPKCGRQYTVHEGDYCLVISQSFGIPLQALYAMNPVIDSECFNLEVGQRLCVQLVDQGVAVPSPPPGSSPVIPRPPPAPPPVVSPAIVAGTCAVTHVVTSGDTCLVIVQAHPETSLETLYTLNPAVDRACTNLDIGQVLCLALRTSPAAGSNTTTAPTEEAPRKSSTSIGLIVGLAVGSGVALALCVTLLVLGWFHLKRKREVQRGTAGRGAEDDSALASVHIARLRGASVGDVEAGSQTGQPKDSRSDLKPGGLGDAGSSASLRLELATAIGLYADDPFVWALSSHFKWSSEQLHASIGVEEGVTAARLAAAVALAYSAQPDNRTFLPRADAAGPEPQELTAVQVQQQIVLMSRGLLGAGATAGVFKCAWPAKFGPHALLACKVMRTPQAGDHVNRLLSSFQYEAALLSALRHPNVVRLYGYCLEPPNVCLIMELLPHSLLDLLYDTAPRHDGASPSTVTCASQPPETVPEASTHASGAALLFRTKSGGAAGETGGPAGSTRRSLTPVDASSTTATTTATALTNMSGSGVSRSGGSTSMSGIGSMRSRSGTFGPAAREASIKPPHVLATERLTPRPVCLLTNLELLRVARDVASGLAHLHALPDQRLAKHTSSMPPELNQLLARVMHRDLKPANILIGSNRDAKITDFGLAREHHATTYHTNYGAVGTLRYQAPETLLHSLSSTITSQIDIFSLGIILWELAAQQVPWKDVADMQVHMLVQQGGRLPIPPLARGADAAHPPASQAVPPHATAVPFGLLQLPAYAHLVESCWQGSPGSRPVAAEVLRQLDALLQALTTPAE